MGFRKIDYEASARRYWRYYEPLEGFAGRVLDRVFILTCWALLAFMVAVVALAALTAL